MIKFNLFYCDGFVEVPVENVRGFTWISEDQCRLLIGTDLENANVVDVREEYLTLVREIGVASFGSEEKQ